MRGRAQDIVFGVAGQSLIWDAPEGRPSAVTDVQVFAMDNGDDSTEEAATTGAASIDSVNTTVDQASGAGQTDPRKLYVTSTVGFEKARNYLVVDDDTGLSEWIHVVAIESGVSVTARDPMANAYSVGAAVVGTRLSIAVSDAWAADTGNISDDQDVFAGYRARWIYVAGGVTRVWQVDFDLVRYGSGHTVVLADVDEEFPGVRQRLPQLQQMDEGRRLIDRAHEQVRWDLVDVHLDDARVRSIDAINRAVILRTGVLLARAAVMAGKADRTALDDATGQYEAFLNKVFRSGPKVPVSTDTSGAGVKTSAPPLFGR